MGSRGPWSESIPADAGEPSPGEPAGLPAGVCPRGCGGAPRSDTMPASLAEARDALRREVQERAELARDTYQHAREERTDRVRAGLAALRAATQRRELAHGLGYT